MKTVAGEGKKGRNSGGPAEGGPAEGSSGGRVQRFWSMGLGLGFRVKGSGQRFLGTKTETEQKENEE